MRNALIAAASIVGTFLVLLVLGPMLGVVDSATPAFYLVVALPIALLIVAPIWIAATRKPKPTAPAVAPGWYPDNDPRLIRWHDGLAWTNHVQPRQMT